MKPKYKLLWVLIAASLLTSCAKDVLDIKPTDQVNDELLWRNQDMVQAYTSNFYAQLPAGYLSPYPGASTFYWLLSAATDDATTGITAASVLWNGTYDGSTSPLNGNWTSRYTYIRRANVFLQKIDGVPGDRYLNQRMKGEIKFLRAFYYFDLMNWFGGIPLVTSAQTDIDSTAFMPRNTFDQCTDFLVNELRYAADSCLPASYTSDQWGRITKGAALALMSRVQLYAGRWADAAATAQKIMSSGTYALQSSYANVFANNNKMNNEIILSVQFNNNASQRSHFFDLQNQPPTFGGRGATQPSQNLVDDYEMKATGLPITDPASGYNPQQPYIGRDPRLTATVLYDSAIFRGRPMQLYTGGMDITISGSILAAWITQTGYYLKKFTDETINLSDATNANSSQNWILFRYAEVLLNYAEAQNEAVGPDASVYSAVNLIRQRAGMPNLATGLSQTQMRNAIRHERRIELAFEDHRYWDVKRWKLATTLFSSATNPIKRMTITRNATTGVKTYTVSNLPVTRNFIDKHYLFPLPLTELTKPGNKMIQNPGW
jgi:hypothetical protein